LILKGYALEYYPVAAAFRAPFSWPAFYNITAYLAFVYCFHQFLLLSVFIHITPKKEKYSLI